MADRDVASQRPAKPTRGAAREPDRLRVADHTAEAELVHAFRSRFSIEVAATPELDDLFTHFLEKGPDGDLDASYLEGGRVPEPIVARMFQAGAMLYRAAPWKAASDDQVLRMDIPGLGVEGACVSIIGALGESLGVTSGHSATRAAIRSPSRPPWRTGASR